MDDDEVKTISTVKNGSVVLVNNNVENKEFVHCLARVNEVYKWGVQGFVMIPGPHGVRGRAYVRLGWDEFEVVGFVPKSHSEPLPKKE